MISVKMTTAKGALHQMAVAAVADLRRNAIRILQKAGEEAVNMARSHTEKTGTDWKDQTGNLRSSIGYIICEDGMPIETGSFKQEKPTAKEGVLTGMGYAYQLASHTKGLALIVVAGMNYATYVADKGYDVLSSAQILAEMRIPKLFQMTAEADENR